MADESVDATRLTCLGCGFAAPVGEAWDRVAHPPLGTLTRCPECGSTNVHSHE
ncbi:hypothetical protein [Halorarum salinum]|uniref:Small CPxCG-related zinc finger protein n=1 Tax=Halorarum salinum TaxID=2743089 RepID=A0A7D5LEV4_9EURY|nr:hypothetical protein [Halobaculum salinum]QLG64295.1 hypothetical protein HUG12_21175 [Halobaculum salinum]